jgi:hypothetical protein
LLIRSGLPFVIAVGAYWIQARSTRADTRALTFIAIVPVLLAVTFEEYSEARSGVRGSDDLTTLFNVRIVGSVAVSAFDLAVVAALAASVVMLSRHVILREVRQAPRVLRWSVGGAATALVYGALVGAVRIRGSEEHELFHLLREVRPLALAVLVLVLVFVARTSRQSVVGPVVVAIWAGVLARALVGSIRHLAGGGRWYHGDRMVYFDATDSVLFFAMLVLLAGAVVRSSSLRTTVLSFAAAAPLTYGLVFSYRRSVWLGVALALVVAAVFERRSLLPRARLVASSVVVVAVLLGVGLTQTSPSFVIDRVTSVADLEGEASNVFRVHDLRNGLHDVASNRGLGAGFGGRAEVVSSTPDQQEFIEHAARANHNSAVYLVMKMGVLAGGAWLLLLLATAVEAARAGWLRPGGRPDEARVLAPVLLAAGLASMFLPFVYNVRPMVLWGFAAGLVWAARPARATRTGHPVAPPSSVSGIAAG